jgi:hypothetical protein
MTLNIFDDPVSCLRCQSTHTRVLTFSEQTNIWHWFLRCAACGHEWTIAKHARAERPAPVVHA